MEVRGRQENGSWDEKYEWISETLRRKNIEASVTGKMWGLWWGDGSATSLAWATGEIVVLLLNGKIKEDEMCKRR